MAGSALLKVVEELLGGELPVAAEVAIILDLPDVVMPTRAEDQRLRCPIC